MGVGGAKEGGVKGIERERRKARDEDEGRTGQMAGYIFNIAAIDFRFSPRERQNVRCTVWVVSTCVRVSVCVCGDVGGSSNRLNASGAHKNTFLGIFISAEITHRRLTAGVYTMCCPSDDVVPFVRSWGMMFCGYRRKCNYQKEEVKGPAWRI